MRYTGLLLIGLMGLIAGPAASAEIPDSIDYKQHVAPILNRYCAGCHNADEPEGKFSVGSFAELQKGGASGPAVLPQRADDSRMIRMLTGAAEPRMPPEDNEVPTADDIEVLRRWIDAGARGPAGQEPDRKQLMTPRIEPADDVPQPITALAASPDGRLLAAARYQRVELLDRDSRQLVATLEGFPGKVTAVHFGADGEQLVAASGVTGLYGEASLWSISEAKLLRRFEGHNDMLYDAELSPDGKWLATCSYDKKVLVWDALGGEVVRALEGHNDAVYDLAFSPDGSLLATASGDETVKIWHVASGRRLDTLSQPEAEQNVVAFSPDGRLVLAGGADNRIRVWRLLSREAQRINPLVYARFAHEGAVIGLAFSPDGRQMVSVAEDRTVKLWETDSYTQVHLYEQQPDVVSGLAIPASSEEAIVARLDGSLGSYPLLQGRQRPQAALRQKADEPMPEDGDWQELAEQEPNDAVAEAAAIHLPARIKGTIHNESVAGGDRDLFRFHSQAGQQWMIEVNAARQKSPLDSKVEVLDSRGLLVQRVLLRAVRDSYFTFRGKDWDTSDDFRVHNWEEMELNELLYANGEVVKLWHYPRGPDSGFQVYPGSGKRHTFFDTTAMSHALHEPCYIVEAYPPGTELIPNGLPTFPIFYENDDDGLRELGSDSRLSFQAPADGDYLVRISDARGFEGSEFHYELTVRPRRPDFKLTIAGTNPTVAAGSGSEFSVAVQRIDGFDGEIAVQVEGLPPGFYATSPLVIEAGQYSALGTIYAAPDAPEPVAENSTATKLTARAQIAGAEVIREIGSLGEIKLDKKPKLRVRVVAADSQQDFDEVRLDEPLELTIAPGETIEAKVIVQREEFKGPISFGKADAGRNLPHGVYVDNIGLNGLLIVEGRQERTFFITAAKWLPEMTRVFHLRAETAGNPTSWPVVLHVRPAAKDGG